VTRQRTEIILEDMVLLDSKGAPTEEVPEQPAPPEEEIQLPEEKPSTDAKTSKANPGAESEEISEDEIPF